MLCDALNRCLKQLSLYLQSQEATILTAASHIDDTINKLQGLKEVKYCEAGQDVENEEGSVYGDKKGIVTTMSKFLEHFQKDQHYKGVKIEIKATDAASFEKRKGQFLQSLCDNLCQRFPSSELIEAAACLNKSTWPANPLDTAL